MPKSIVLQFLNENGSFHPLKTKGASRSYISFEVESKPSLILHFHKNRLHFKDFGGNHDFRFSNWTNSGYYTKLDLE